MPTRHASSASISTQLLQTKLHLPALQTGYVARPRLAARLDAIQNTRLTLVSAPAGFGKTTLLAAWCAGQQARRIAWLGLEASDDNPPRFLTYVCAALQSVDARLGANALSLLQAPTISLQLVLPTVLNSFTEDVEPLALVLDDVHLLESAAVTEILAFLIEHCPPALHLVLATRADPGLPLSRYRARGQLNEIRADDLRFTPDEATTFLNTVMGLNLTRREIETLDTRTEGWIAGLQLAALSMRDRTDRAQFIAAFGGSHRFILDYLIEQVLLRQTPAMQTFLLQTSILERMNAELCQAVTGQRDAQTQLEWLETHNLFVLPLDDTRTWYRYHPLFADVLQHRMRTQLATGAAELHTRAREWFLANGQYIEAIKHALATNDFTTTADIIEHDGSTIALEGQPHLVIAWVAALPDSLVASRPMILAAVAISELLTDQLREAGKHLRAAEYLLADHGDATQLEFVRTWQAICRGEEALQVGDLPTLVTASREGLKVAAPTASSRLPLLVRVAREFQYTGDVSEQAERALADLVPLLRNSRNLYTRLNNIVYLARLQTFQGRFRQAYNTLSLATQIMPAATGHPTSVIHPVYYAGLADILFEWNRLPEAAALLEQGMTLIHSSLSVDADAWMLQYTTHVRVLLAQGDFEAAQETLEQFSHILTARRFVPAYTAQLPALQTQLELERGNLEAALRWAQANPFMDVAPEFLREFEMLTWVRVWLNHARTHPHGTPFAALAQVLARWGADAAQKMRHNSETEIVVLQALLAEVQKDSPRALAALAHALEMGQPENYVRVFADYGAPMHRLLLRFAEQNLTVSKKYFGSVLGAFAPAPARIPQSAATPVADALSMREVQVLRLVAQGASNQEIAGRLVIALPTVKRHISNIYDKLAVTSRTQAVARAQELHLL